MREVLTIHLGQAGVGMGRAAWEMICTEHGLLSEHCPPSADDYFHSMIQPVVAGSRYEPRALFIDSEASVIDSLRSSPLGGLMKESQMISGNEDASGLYAIGYNSVGPSLVEKAMEEIRKMTEQCTGLQGFMFQHAVSGGTGSALSEILLTRLQEEYPRVSLHTASLFPERFQNESVVEPYNTVFAARGLLEKAHVSLVYDNEAIRGLLGCASAPQRKYEDLNQVIAQAFSAMTASFRYEAALNVDMNEIITNLVPYPSIHFVLQSIAPVDLKCLPYHHCSHTAEISNAMFFNKSCLASCDLLKGYFMACCMSYRGYIIPKDVGAAVATMKTKRIIRFVDWSPAGFRCGINYQPMSTPPSSILEAPTRSLMMLSNSTAVKDVFISATDRFEKLFRKRSFVHWFTKYGYEEAEFDEAQHALASHISDYKEVEAPTDEGDVVE